MNEHDYAALMLKMAMKGKRSAKLKRLRRRRHGHRRRLPITPPLRTPMPFLRNY